MYPTRALIEIESDNIESMRKQESYIQSKNDTDHPPRSESNYRDAMRLWAQALLSICGRNCSTHLRSSASCSSGDKSADASAITTSSPSLPDEAAQARRSSSTIFVPSSTTSAGSSGSASA